ncbi:hypothetical protein [Streptomyces nojiriensis]|uniref:hypothetical protein n=1 Tax=Streptomyces nojiriensis TaxID=66374 RepID=UPI0016781155|nr:hypothetical protein [Streptomyces nojiriensis]
MSGFRQIAAVGSAVALIACLGVGSAQASAPVSPDRQFGGCGQSFDPWIWGGEAHWVNSCKNGKITVQGWVKDTDGLDNECVYVVAKFAADITEVSRDACGGGNKVAFKWTHAGSIADVELRKTR